jgi:hypothetical protein
MIGNRATRLVCCLMVMLVPAALIGADMSAVLSGSGDVKVNGNRAKGTATVYAGDVVQTAKGSSATISSNGTTVSMAENSTAAYNGNDIAIKDGRTLVSTRKGTVARFANLVITPASDNARFQAAKLNGKYQVAALLGPVSISDGTNSMLLKTGEMIQKSDQEPAPPAPASSKKKRGAGGALPGWELALITAGVAGGVVGGLAAAGTFGGGKKESPTKP